MKRLVKSLIAIGVVLSVIVVAGLEMAQAAPIELKVLGLSTKTKSGFVYPEKNAYVIQEIERKYGIRLIPVEVPENDQQQLTIMLASGDLPDMFMIYKTMTDLFLKEGVCRLITFEEWEKYAPTWRKIFSDPAYKRLPVYEDQKGVWGMPHIGYYYKGTFFSSQTLMQVVRLDWLKKLGLSLPANLDEYTAMLKAFTENDPDGNGQKDTWGTAISGKREAEISEQVQFAYWAMGGHGILGQTELVDGQLTLTDITETYKKTLQYLAEMFAKGYIYPDVNIDRYQGIFPLVENSKIGAHGTTFTWIMPKYRPNAYYDNLQKKVPGAELEMLKPYSTVNVASQVWAYWGFRKDISQEKFEAGMKLLELQLTDETYASSGAARKGPILQSIRRPAWQNIPKPTRISPNRRRKA